MILLVDHQDSFTRNLEHQLSFLDEVLVQDRRKITEKSIEAAQLIVLSPDRENHGITLKPLRSFQNFKSKFPYSEFVWDFKC